MALYKYRKSIITKFFFCKHPLTGLQILIKIFKVKEMHVLYGALYALQKCSTIWKGKKDKDIY